MDPIVCSRTPPSMRRHCGHWPARLAASIERRDERTYVAPSAWHAAAWLLDVTALIGQGAAVDGDSGLRVPYDAKYGAPVFRGQRDPSQRLLPTLYRDDITAEDTIALQLLVGALKQLFAPLGDPVSAQRAGSYGGVAASRHADHASRLHR